MAVYGGVLATNDEAAALLLDKAKSLGIQYRAKYLELRGNPYQQAREGTKGTKMIQKTERPLRHIYG